MTSIANRLYNLHNKNLHLVKKIDDNIGVLILATLYWCEGSKYPSSVGVKFGNSDPNMISLFLSLLRKCFNLDERKFRLGIQCRADQNTTDLIEYWTNLTHISPQQTYRPKVDPRSIGKPTLKTNYRGVCVIYYFDTDLQCELQFLGEYLGTKEAMSMMQLELK